jgi:hypothetical protein
MRTIFYLTGLLVWAVGLFLALEMALGRIDCLVTDAGPKVYIVACGVREASR